MKNKIIYFVSVCACLLLFFSCTNEEVLGNKINGTWYLKSFNGSSVNWGEYMSFSGNQLKWNSRIAGDNTTYSITYSNGNITIDARCTYSSSGNASSRDNSFTVTTYTSSSLVLIDQYFDVREFRKK